ncbi:DUF885 domain-containing protein [Actinopolymorpha rutila]|uniref:Uncharacterized protein (DUF885 family) n=1 Tax=Actinopolymorpha rutila TaxID=446787 RepID=A0A852ZJA2_9ACTN|nr:DUF885 domain-containing protein [Actinopolymorpha rutila]NYH91692.1 uncharacterized protein (DUF885 family) [Actinopolymorpha rutila]
MGRTDEIADRYVDDYAAADPVGATFAGIAGYDDQLTDYSPDGFDRRADLARAAVRELQATEPQDERETVARAAMLERLGLELERHDAGVTTSDLNVVASPLQDVRGAFDLMPTDSEAAWATVAARLARIPDALGGFRLSLAEAAADGRVAARRQIDACADQCRSWLPPEDDFFGSLVAQAGVDSDGGVAVGSALRADLARGAEVARQSVADFERFLRTELAPKGRTTDGVGEAQYALASRYFLGAAVDLAETYAWGWEELTRIETDMRGVADRIVPGGSVADAVSALDTDPQRRIADKDAFREWMQELADRTLAELAGVHFDIPEEIRRIECRIAPTSDGSIYYTAPSEDLARPGRMWWSVPKGVTSFATWKEVTTVFHEGVPGHHLQVAQTVVRKDLLNRWQRLLCWVSGHGEGWALYAERLMDDLGYLDEPGAKLGMLDAQALRAARVVVDLGLHLGYPIPPNAFGWRVGERWTPELALEFMLAHTRVDEDFLRFEVNRYLGWPAQAPSYKVGERIWLAAREDARARKGSAFDLKEFHRAALDLGALGLDPLRDALARL